MCSCKGGAYLAVSVFVYRSIMVILLMISSSITRYKSSYLPITVMEELLLQLIYFIFLFTSSCFIFIGLESNSFTYVFYSTLMLGLTLFVRYTGELAYIYAQGWDAYKIKLPQIYLYLVVDLCLLLVLILYARKKLRSKRPWKNSKDIYESEMNGSPEGEKLIHNNLKAGGLVTAQPTANPKKSGDVNLKGPSKTDNVTPEREGQSLTYYHYPPIVPISTERAKKPQPPLPKDELDDISLPPPITMACPDDDEF